MRALGYPNLVEEREALKHKAEGSLLDSARKPEEEP
jgi:hypothetical protein